MNPRTAAAALFVAFLISGGAWIGLAELLPEGRARSVVIVALGVVFAGVFVWLIISRVRRILEGSGNMLRHGAIAVLQLAMLLGFFAALYQQLGIIDNTQPGGPVTHSYFTSLYYSVVTFTTLGYGDFYPRGLGRVLAAIQALTGYVILATLASTTALVLSPYSRAGKGEERKEDRR